MYKNRNLVKTHIVVMRETRKEVGQTTEKLLKASMSMGLCTNENKQSI